MKQNIVQKNRGKNDFLWKLFTEILQNKKARFMRGLSERRIAC